MPSLRNPELFSYVVAFVTIVLALALSDLLMSLHRLIRARDRVKWSEVPLLAAGFVFFVVLSEFFGIWVDADLSNISFAYLVLLVFVSSMATLAAFTVLPDEVPEQGIDLWQAYLKDRVYLFSVLALGCTMDTPRGVIHVYLTDNRLPDFLDVVPSLVLSVIALAAFFLLAWSRKKWVHRVGFVVLYVVSLIGFFGWEIGAP